MVKHNGLYHFLFFKPLYVCFVLNHDLLTIGEIVKFKNSWDISFVILNIICMIVPSLLLRFYDSFNTLILRNIFEYSILALLWFSFIIIMLVIEFEMKNRLKYSVIHSSIFLSMSLTLIFMYFDY
ncbi:Uncharacterised protein [Vibrio owensii]|nr:Uncharacterised protein [Vibrio owensii]